MIRGVYPCCGGDLRISMPEKGGQFAGEDCPHCNAKVWHFLSRILSTTYTEEAFFDKFTLNMETNTVEAKDPEWGNNLAQYGKYLLGQTDDPGPLDLTRRHQPPTVLDDLPIEKLQALASITPESLAADSKAFQEYITQRLKEDRIQDKQDEADLP